MTTLAEWWRLVTHLWYYIWPFVLIVAILVGAFFVGRKWQGL